MITLLVFIGTIFILVIAHEWGHFIIARRSGMKVEEFGFGFPPMLIAFYRDLETGKIKRFKRSEDVKNAPSTVYSLNLLPLGGFVKIKGENADGSESNDSDSFSSAKLYKRFLVLIAGVAANAIIGILIFSFTLSSGMRFSLDNYNVGKFGSVVDKGLYVGFILPGMPGELAGIKSGDKIISADGVVVGAADEFRNIVYSFENKKIEIVYERNKTQIISEVTPVVLKETGKPGVGIEIIESGIVKYPWYVSPYYALKLSGELISTIPSTFGAMFKAIKENGSTSGVVAGPVGIAVMAGEAAKDGASTLLQFIGLLSLNLAVLNILPFPALDGGRLLFVIMEAIFKKRKIIGKIEKIFNVAGFALLILLIITVTVGDLHFFTDIFKNV